MNFSYEVLMLLFVLILNLCSYWGWRNSGANFVQQSSTEENRVVFLSWGANSFGNWGSRIHFSLLLLFSSSHSGKFIENNSEIHQHSLLLLPLCCRINNLFVKLLSLSWCLLSLFSLPLYFPTNSVSKFLAYM